MDTNELNIDMAELMANFTPARFELDMAEAEASDRPENTVAVSIHGYSKTTAISDGPLSHGEDVNGNEPDKINENASATPQADKNTINTTNGSAPIDKNITATTNTATAPAPVIIDTHHPHRYGSHMLPLLPLLTSDYQVPKRFGPTSMHLTTLRSIIAATGIPLHGDPIITHRHRAGQQPGKDTLTLVIQSDSSAKSTWTDCITATRAYLDSVSLTLPIEIIDHRILKGVYTLPILANDPLTKYIAKKKVGIRKVLEEAGVEWASLEFWYRGVGKVREECEATVLIGTTEADKEEKMEIWWGKEGVVEKMREKVKGKMGVEVCWREKKDW